MAQPLRTVRARIGGRIERHIAAYSKRRSYRLHRATVLTRAELTQALPSHTTLYPFGNAESVTCIPPLSPDESPPEIAERYGVTEFDPPFVMEIKQAHLWGRHAVGITPAGEIVFETALNRADCLASANLSRLHYPRSLQEGLHQITHTSTFGCASSLVNVWSAGFYHWFIEALPRVLGLLHYRARTGIMPILLIDPDPPVWLRTSLDYMNYPASHIVEWRSTRADVQRLIIPSVRGIVGFGSPSACRMVSAMLKEQLPPGPTVNAPRIYISRRRASKRRVVNEDAVMTCLEPLGFQAFELETLSLAEQIRLFDQAQVIIGPHGAGMTNMIHARQATIIEIFEQGYTNGCYYTLANGLGFQYHFLMVDTVYEQNMLVNVDKFTRFLQRLDI